MVLLPSIFGAVGKRGKAMVINLLANGFLEGGHWKRQIRFAGIEPGEQSDRRKFGAGK
jgi:hypothetical protein